MGGAPRPRSAPRDPLHAIGDTLTVDGIAGRIERERGNDREKPWTRIRFDWSPPGALRIVTAGFHTLLWKRIFGASDIKLGNAAFDRTHLVQGKPAWWVRVAVDETLRLQVTALESKSGSADVRVEAGPGGVTVWSGRDFTEDPGPLREFLVGAIEILRSLREASTGADIEVVAASEAAFAGHCPVCASEPAGEVHVCDRCRTPHAGAVHLGPRKDPLGPQRRPCAPSIHMGMPRAPKRPRDPASQSWPRRPRADFLRENQELWHRLRAAGAARDRPAVASGKGIALSGAKPAIDGLQQGGGVAPVGLRALGENRLHSGYQRLVHRELFGRLPEARIDPGEAEAPTLRGPGLPKGVPRRCQMP